MKAQRALGWWLSGLYGLHAATSLAYEIVWMRLMAATLGTSLAAMGLVLAVFVAGLGLGAAGLAWWARSRLLPTRWLFVLFKALLGLWGAMLPWLVGWLDYLYIAWAPAAESPGHHGLRFMVSASLLLPPSCLLGAVFPLLSDYVHAPERGATSPGFARLYRAGLLSSAMGAVVASFWMIPAWGLVGTSLLLGALNGLGALIGLLALNSPRQAFASPHAGPSIEPSMALRRWGLLSATLGFCLFAVQVIGAQYLWLLVDATVYVEGMVLGTVLLGMAAGAMLAIHLRRFQIALERNLFVGFLIMAAWQLLWLALAADIARLFEMGIRQSSWIRGSALPFFAAHGVLTLAILGGPVLAAGFMFPTLCTLYASSQPTAVNPIGRVTAWHYLGAGAGATAGAFLLLPLLGATASLTVLTAVALLSAGFLLRGVRGNGRTHVLAWGALGCMALWVGARQDITFRATAAGSHTRVMFHHEDGSGVVEVYEDETTGYRTVLSSRLRQEGGNRPDDLRVQRLQGALPVLLHPVPRQVLVVGLGTGISLAANLRPEVEQLTCVEISPGVVGAAAFFAHDNEDILAHPRLTLLQQDGRNFLKLTRQRYDLIISHPNHHRFTPPMLEQLGSPVLLIEYRSVQEVLANSALLGTVSGRTQEAEALRTALQERIDGLTPGQTATRPRALLLFGTPRSFLVMDEETFVGDLLRLAGGHNIVAELPLDRSRGGFHPLSLESIVKHRPEWVLVITHGDPERVTAAYRQELEGNPAWWQIPAVMRGQVRVLPDDLFATAPGPRLDQALRYLRQFLTAEAVHAH